MDFKLIEQKTAFKGFFKVEEVTFQFEQFQGGMSQPKTQEVFQRGDATAVLLYDPKKDSVVLLEQFRVAIATRSNQAWQYEIVAGMTEPNESPQDVAKRECVEEAGCHVDKLMHILDYYPSPGGSSECVTLFLAIIDASKLSGIHGLEEEGENIQLHIIPRTKAAHMLTEGKINNAAAIIALQWLQLNYKNL